MTQHKYQLYYWPLPFRGCFVSYLFAYSDVPLTIETSIEKVETLLTLPPEEQDLPFMGPPMLQELETGRMISQMPAIVSYASQRLGLSPEDPFDAAMCLKVLMDCNDVLMEICRYNGAMMWERPKWINFRAERLPKWMRIFELSLKRGLIGKEEVSFADIGIYALFGNMIRCLPELEDDLHRHAPGIYQLCLRVGAKPSLAQFVANEERKYGKLYCDGQIEASIRKMLEMDASGDRG